MVQKIDTSKTILVIVTGLLAISLIFEIPMLSLLAVAIGGVCIFFQKVAEWIEWLWLKLAMALGWINSRILLSIVFFVFLLPIAWISRLFVKDPLQLKKKTGATVYANRDHVYTKKDLENIW